MAVDHWPQLRIDPIKWNLFLHRGYHQSPDGWTPEAIFNHRLEEARLQLKYAKYDSRFPPTEFPRMLCIGAGTGAEVLVATELGYKALGIGLLGTEQIGYAHSRGVDFRLMDIHDLKFPNESFDVIYANATFEHCMAPWLVCLEAWAVLRDGGRWWMTLEPYQKGCPGDDGPKMEHYMILSQWYMRPMFNRCGFMILDMEDSKLRYWYLLEKLPLELIPTEQKTHKKNSIVDLLEERLELGREYG